MTFEIKKNNNWASLLINDTLHLLLNTTKLVGVQSWKYKEEFTIEFYFDTYSFISVYQEEGIWSGILNLINTNLFTIS